MQQQSVFVNGVDPRTFYVNVQNPQPHSNPAKNVPIVPMMPSFGLIPTFYPTHNPAYNPHLMQPQNGGTKQQLIMEVREKLHAMLSDHFPHQKEGDVMVVYAHELMPELHEPDEQKDVLRGPNVANARAKNLQSLQTLPEFVEAILAPSSHHTVHRVDLVIQKTKQGQLKGLLVYIQFGNQQQILHVRDTIWKGRFEHLNLKFIVALFAKDTRFKGVPKDLHVYADGKDLRVRCPFPQKLQDLNLEENCRIKSMSVTWKASRGRKQRTFEVPQDQFRQVLSKAKVTVNGRDHHIKKRTTLTISFEEDWKTEFFRTGSAAPVNVGHM